jgi:hypothetical protein
MKFTTYKTHKCFIWFRIAIEAYDLQGDEEISIALVLFGRGFKMLFEPTKRLIRHFEFRLPPTIIVSTQDGVKTYKTKLLSFH